MSDRKYEIREPKENLHWINFSMKKMLDAQAETNRLLGMIQTAIKNLKTSSSSPPSEELPF